MNEIAPIKLINLIKLKLWKKISGAVVLSVIILYYPVSWWLDSYENFKSLQDQTMKLTNKLKLNQQKLKQLNSLNGEDLKLELNNIEHQILNYENNHFQILTLEWQPHYPPRLTLRVQTSFFYFYAFLKDLSMQYPQLQVQKLQLTKIDNGGEQKLLIEAVLPYVVKGKTNA